VYRPKWQAATGNPETLAKIQMLAMVESVKKMQIDGGGNDGVLWEDEKGWEFYVQNACSYIESNGKEHRAFYNGYYHDKLLLDCKGATAMVTLRQAGKTAVPSL
jgi:hypothetical protein